MKSVLEVIRSTTAYFEKHGIESPRLNIEHLLAHVLGKKRMDLYLEFDRPLGEKELEPLRELVRRRSAREPLQHLMGTVEFLGHTIRTDVRALIPRPETEQLCELLISLGKPTPFTRIADIGTGTGVIAISLASAFPEASVVAVDVWEPTLALAKENAVATGTERIDFRQGHLATPLDGTFDLLVANLPYIASGELAALQPEVQFDPPRALDGGADGLILIRDLIQSAPAFLKGLLALEIGAEQGPAVLQLLEEHGYRDARLQADYQGRNRFVFAIYG